jgi:integrase
VALRDVRTLEVELMLRDIAARSGLSRTTLIHIKHFLGGVFTYARRVGVLNGPNPVRDAEVPPGRAKGETHACTLEEILAYLRAVPEPGTTLIATAAFTWVHKSELRALRWENFDGQAIRITQKAWGRHVGPPKRDSRGDVPVIALLARYLDRHRLTAGDPASGYIFRNSQDGPIGLDRVTAELIRPALAKEGLRWWAGTPSAAAWPPTCTTSGCRTRSSSASCATPISPPP